MDAFLAMLVKSWIQEFDRAWKNNPGARFRAEERERRLQSLERWKLANLIPLLSILIQISLLLFCIGLIVLLFPIHLMSAILSLVALVAGLTFYWLTISVCVFDDYAPFSSPVSRGLIILVHLIAHHVQHIISGIPFRTSPPSPPREHEANMDHTTKSSSGSNRVDHSSLPQGSVDVEKQEIITRSQTYVNILERLVKTTSETVENIPVFLFLLDQPVNDLTVRPSNVDNWKELLHTTLRLLGDPSTFSDSTACTVIRSLQFCYDGKSADAQLSQSLIRYFDHMCSGQTGKHKPLNSLFVPYLRFCCQIRGFDPTGVANTIAFLEPSNTADTELLWMVNTIHRKNSWQYYSDVLYSEPLEFFAAVLTYVSTTEQSRRSQVPLTAAVIYAVHTIKLAIDNGFMDSVGPSNLSPGTVLTTLSTTFCQVATLNLWSDECVKCARYLLKPCHWPRFKHDDIRKFRLALIAALYIDSTKQGHQAATSFASLLKDTDIPDIKEGTWGWAGAYDQTRLAGYWYTAVFKVAPENSHLGDIIMQIIIQIKKEPSEMTLSALHLLDYSVKYLCERSPTSTLLTMDPDGLCLKWADTDGPARSFAWNPFRDFDPWLLLHLETLFPQSHVLCQTDCEQLKWDDAPVHVHMAMSRLVCYDSKKTKPEPDLLNLFLTSKDYDVCTGAFSWCLNLASSAGDIQRVFIPRCQWVENLIRVLCEAAMYNKGGSWKFLAAHLTPQIWDMLPLPWRCEFASAFLFLIVGGNELPAYQRFFHTVEDADQTYQPFLPFLVTMLEIKNHKVTWDQLKSLDTWMAGCRNYIKYQDGYVKLATRKQELENLRFFEELQCTQNDQ